MSRCSDSPNPRDPAVYPAVARRAYTRSGAFGPEQAWFLVACADWPAAAAQASVPPTQAMPRKGPRIRDCEGVGMSVPWRRFGEVEIS